MRRIVYLLLLASCILFPATVHAGDLPPSAYVEGFAGYPQEHNLSCESRSATDLAAFWGAAFSEDDFFRRLPRSDNPNRGFLGDVDLPPGSMPPVGYGVYAGPIAANLRSFGLDAQARLGWDLESLKAELAAGRPVVIWATYDMKLPDVQTWTSSDGVTSVVVMWQHTFVAVGYDEDGIHLVDAYDGVTKYYSYGSFVPAWDQLGRQGVTVANLSAVAQGAPLAQPGGRVWRAAADGVSLVVDGRWMAGPE